MNRKNLQQTVSYLVILLVVGFVIYNSFFSSHASSKPARPPLETAYTQGIESLVPMLFMQFMAVALLGLTFATILNRYTGIGPSVRVSSKPGSLFLVLIVLAFAAVTGSLTLGMVRGMGLNYHYYRLSPPPIYLAGDPLYLLNLVLSFLPLIISASALVWLTRRMRRRVEELQQATIADVSEPDAPMPGGVKAWDEALLALGFTRLGEGQHRKAGQSKEQFDPLWLWICDEGRELAMLTMPQASKSSATFVFMSFFHDGAVVETYFPHGMRLHRRDHIIDHEASSVEAAHQLHRKQVASLVDAHGEPLSVVNMRTAIEQAQQYNSRHLGTIVEHIDRQMLAFPTGLFVVSVLGGGLTLASALTRGLVGNNLIGFVFPASFFSLLYWGFAREIYKTKT